MANLDPPPFWSSVLLSDSSTVKWVGSWNTDGRSSYYNVSNPKTATSVAFTFNGTHARAIGLTTTSDTSPLNFWMKGSSGRPFEDNHAGDGPNSGNLNATSPHAFYLSGNLPCEQYTLNIVVKPTQAMQINQFDFIPCTSDGNSASASTITSTTASASTSASKSSQNSALTGKKQALNKTVIIGAFIGVLAVLALGCLALFIILRRRRRLRHRAFPSPQSQPPPPPPLMNSLSRSRPWLRLPGPQPKPITPPVTFLTTTFSSSSPAAAAAATAAPVDGSGSIGLAGSISRQGYSTTMLNAPAAHNSGSASASASAFPAPAPDPATSSSTAGLSSPALPWLVVRSAARYPGDRGYARGAQQQQNAAGDGTTTTAAEKQPRRPDDDADLEPGGPAIARGYLPDSKELVEWERSGAQGYARASRADSEALPRYKSQGSFRWSSEPFSPAPFAF